MKKALFFILLSAVVLTISLGSVASYRLFSSITLPDSDRRAPNHDTWDVLLKAYVKNGHVDYGALYKTSGPLNNYLTLLQSQAPSADWSSNERLAYWINAYNAFTIQIILDHYPVKSIKDIGDKVQIPLINSTWDIKFINIGGKELSLNDIEHRILRQEFNEPRIHFAIVCASKSCPPLRSEAYSPEKIDEQLEDQAIDFVNDKTNNHTAESHIEISKIFNWFEGDFTKEGSLIDFLNKYSQTRIDANAAINYLDYDWSLNDWLILIICHPSFRCETLYEFKITIELSGRNDCLSWYIYTVEIILPWRL